MIPWSNGQPAPVGVVLQETGKVCAANAGVKLAPPLSDSAIMIALGVLPLPNCRQATYTSGGSRLSVPGMGGATTITDPWFTPIELTAMGVLQVAPQLVDRVNRIADWVSLFTKSLKVI